MSPPKRPVHSVVAYEPFSTRTVVAVDRLLAPTDDDERSSVLGTAAAAAASFARAKMGRLESIRSEGAWRWGVKSSVSFLGIIGLLAALLLLLDGGVVTTAAAATTATRRSTPAGEAGAVPLGVVAAAADDGPWMTPSFEEL